MLPADDIIINILLGTTTGSIYAAALAFLWPILRNYDLAIASLLQMQEEMELHQDGIFNQADNNAKK